MKVKFVNVIMIVTLIVGISLSVAVFIYSWNEVKSEPVVEREKN